jgi:hypothetical protein
MNKNNISTQSDTAGIASALLCMIHCLVVPVFFLLKFWLSENVISQLPPWWEKIDYFFLLISFLAVYHSTSHTRFIEIRIALWIFWITLAIAILFAHSMHWMAYIASAGLIVTHYLNIRSLKKMVSYS